MQEQNIQEWVFAEVLFDAAPAEFPRKIKHRREDVRDAKTFGFVCDGRGRLLQKVGVERRGEADWGGPDRPVVREPMQA